MRPDPDACRDPDLLAAEVRRLQAVIAASEPKLTVEERASIEVAAIAFDREGNDIAAVLRHLLERLA
jgi:urease accessory protein UreE